MSETYGLMIYQEQFMLRVHTLAGWTLGKGDSLRKVKNILSNNELRHEFVNDCDIDNAELAWREIAESIGGGYNFNKSHACSYAYISYYTAWLKYYYPLEFMCAVMTHEQTDIERLQKCLVECKRLEINVLPPALYKSSNVFSIEDNSIRASFNCIRGITDNTLVELTNLRDINTIDDLLKNTTKKVCDKTVVTNLIKSGCLDHINDNRITLLHEYTLARGTKKEKAKFVDDYGSVQYNDIVRYQFEFDAYGGYLFSTPFDKYYFDSLDKFANQTNATIGGIVIGSKIIKDKKGKEMAFVALQTRYGIVECVLFSYLYKQYETLITTNKVVMISGKRDGDKLLINNIKLI